MFGDSRNQLEKKVDTARYMSGRLIRRQLPQFKGQLVRCELKGWGREDLAWESTSMTRIGTMKRKGWR